MKVEIIKESVSSGKYSLNFGHWRTGNGKSFNSERELIEFLEDNCVENGTVITQSQNVTDQFSKYFQHPPKDAHISKEFFDRGYELIVGEGESGPSTSNKTIDDPSKPITESNNTEFQIPPNSEMNSKGLEESITDMPIEDIEAFITEVKERFPGSEAVYDGDTNEIRISLR